MSTLNLRDFIKSGGVITVGVVIMPACASEMGEEASCRFFTKITIIGMY